MTGDKADTLAKVAGASFAEALQAALQERGPIPADREVETANEVAKREGAVGALFGEEMLVPVAQDARTYNTALAEALAGARETGRTVTRDSSGRTVLTIRGQRQVAEGVVQEVEVRARVDEEGNTKTLATRAGEMGLDRQSMLGEVMAKATQGPWYHGSKLDGSIIRPVKALQEEADRFRVLSGFWDTIRRCVPPKASIKVSPWKPKQGRAWKTAIAEWEVNKTEIVPIGGQEDDQVA